MNKFFKTIFIRMLIVIALFATIAFFLKKTITIGILIGGCFSILQFFYFKRKLKLKVRRNQLPTKGILSYLFKLGIAVIVALGISYFNKMIAIGFLIGLPAMQIGMMTTAFNRKILEDFMKDNYHEDESEK